jgi:hypothetical protein
VLLLLLPLLLPTKTHSEWLPQWLSLLLDRDHFTTLNLPRI